MERFMIFCYVLLSMAIISDAALCISTVDCPGNDTLCILNCSEIAVNDFNQPASHGNCRNFLTFEDVTVQDCYIDQCNASHPELCVPAEAFNDHTAGIATGCCCAEDLCNSRFDFLDETTTLPTNTPGETHIYSTYPTHITSDELVCIYQECISGDCDSFKYEVCSENPVYASVTAGRHICHAILFVDTETGSYMADRNCYDDPHSLCTEECEPKLHPAFPYINNTALYDCCCIGNLCNYVILNYTATAGPPPTTAEATSDDDNYNYIPLICGTVGGIGALIVLTAVIIILAYCYFYRGRPENCTQWVSYKKFTNS